MDSPDEISEIIFASLADLSVPGMAESVQASIARGIKQLSVYRILELRERIEEELDVQLPIVRETLDLLDGQLALREIAGAADWR